MVTKLMKQNEKIQYAESLLSVAKKVIVNKQFDLSIVDHNYLKERIFQLINDNQISQKRKKFSTILNVMFLSIIMIISLIFVPEADYKEHAQEVYEEEGAFSITADDSYFIKSPDGYKLYMNGEYVTTIKNIPSDLKEVPVYEKENEY